MNKVNMKKLMLKIILNKIPDRCYFVKLVENLTLTL